MTLAYRGPDWARPAIGGALVGLATGVSTFLTRYTIYTTKLVRRGDVLDDPVEKTLIGRVRAEGLMGREPAIIGETLSIKDAATVVRESGTTVVPVVATDGTFLGTLSALAVATASEQGIDTSQPVTSLQLGDEHVRRSEFASVVLRTLLEAGVEGIAVTDDDGKLIGWVAQRDLVRRIYRQQRRALEQAESESSWGSRMNARIAEFRRHRDSLEAHDEGRL
ncbi:hypothetical protein BSZ39_01555 [Bowdeniella nasicola]|uniref:CBS domain-containing protein n=1 Tax=Bowdeniella nasicola TaxID=208480 RepID=A0A1Q5Q532_9ACTO|nr:CBS domain-containing protein [Bowdeniella nasicola]OKL54893.1 hypothetical protein BSZ39_01555 [Bowdeniella nasicola]